MHFEFKALEAFEQIRDRQKQGQYAMSAPSNHHYIRCVVPLEHTEKEYTKTQMVAYKLRTVPTDVDRVTLLSSFLTVLKF